MTKVSRHCVVVTGGEEVSITAHFNNFPEVGFDKRFQKSSNAFLEECRSSFAVAGWAAFSEKNKRSCVSLITLELFVECLENERLNGVLMFFNF